MCVFPRVCTTFLSHTQQAAHFQVLSSLPSERVQHLTSMAAHHLCLDYPSLGCHHLSPALSQWPCCWGSWLLSPPAYHSLSTQEPQGSLPPLLRNTRAAASHADMVPYDQVPWHIFGFISHYLLPFLTQLQPHQRLASDLNSNPLCYSGLFSHVHHPSSSNTPLYPSN